MRVVLTRSGGFAGRTVRHVIDTSQMALARGREIETLVTSARRQPPPRNASPDSFHYEIEIDGERYDVGDGPGVWRTLIDTLMTAKK
jgi:hypothetical protein